jgi:NitT/TauT family transport system permease protein
MAAVARLSEGPRAAAGDTAVDAPALSRRHRASARRRLVGGLARCCWTLLSVGTFAAIWEACWYAGLADARLLPPPHIFLGDFAGQAKFFNTATRWSIGINPADGPSPYAAVLITIAATTMRVVVGLLIASLLGIAVGILTRYFLLFERLTLPTITLLSPVSPIAWLPVAIFLFGIGNAPAIFMVVIALFFHMVLATVSQIDGVNRNLINVARTMGASKRQTYARVIIPAILPGLLVVLRMNLFAAWMVVLVAESTGVGYGLGQVIMMARNTFNPSLVFFTIALIGLLGFTFDLVLRTVQRRILYWVPETAGVLRGL